MRKYGYLLLWQVRLGIVALCILVLAACDTGTNTTAGTPTPNGTGQVLIQLFPSPGNISPAVNGVPMWTLYADGTLLFQSKNAALFLLEAHLSKAETQHILDVVVNQDHFFDSTRAFYGKSTPDVGATLLRVNDNGQQKTVGIGGKESSQADQQTTNIFAIQQFLLQQEPADATPYDPSEIALLVLPGGQSASGGVWPFDDISLAQIASQECPLVTPRAGCAATGQKAAIKKLGGSQAKAILGGSGFTQMMKQDSKAYRVIPWPLLPDALHPAPGTTAMLTVAEGRQLMQWPLSA